MTPQELRIAIAKDVLERTVENKRIEVSTDDYLQAENERACQVCAISSLVLTGLENPRLGKSLETGEDLAAIINAREDNDRRFKRLVNQATGWAFENDQLGLIEAAFMGRLEGFWGNPNLGYLNAAGREIKAREVEQYGDETALDDPDQQKLYLELQRAERFGEDFVRRYDEEEDDGKDYDAHRELLRAIMQNIIDHEGTFIP